LLAGRKLLLADDSVTIQKVIDLTFADEGVRVITFDNGQAAIENLEQVAPDIVLADVFMPGKNGYEVCEYVKGNEKLKHIPVMLLVGSFEPFDEAEARRVGADDTLTKPFQSIRRLIDRVGSLVGNPPAQHEVPTAELPKTEYPPVEEQRLSTQELEFTTADTLQLSEDRTNAEILAAEVSATPASAEEQMETARSQSLSESQVESDGLLDLGELEPRSVADDDFVLDLGMEDSYSTVATEAAPSPKAFIEPAISETVESTPAPFYGREPEYAPVGTEVAAYTEVHEVMEPVPASSSFDMSGTVASQAAQPAVPLTDVTAGGLSPAMIDAIARRAVEMLSEKVVREIAWEVVPELAELMIKRQLEESQQHK
jgi:CheY-like chemotaxis protein